jgi:hypothetical protein
MEGVESIIHFKTKVKNLQIYPLDGKGARLPALTGEDVRSEPGGLQIHLQSQKQSLAPWYEIVAKP